MPEDASLDDFLSDDRDEESSVKPPGETAAQSAADPETDSPTGPETDSPTGPETDSPTDPETDASIEPATATSRWTPDGTCAACGEAASRLWRDAAGQVCAGCKDWSEG